jgi:hypothetical protein
MKRSILAMLAFMAVAMPLPGKVSIQVDWVSRYIWRGFDLLPDNHAAIQPSLTADLGRSGFSLNLWSSFALAQRGTLRYSDEIDLTLSYTFAMPEGWELSAGINHYGYWFADGFTFKDDTSQEIFVALARTDLPLSPTLSAYYDCNLGSGLYVSLAFGHEIRMSDQLGIELGGLIGFNSGQYIEGTGFSDIDLYVSVPLTAGKLTLTPSFNIMIPLLNEVNEDVEIWFGFAAAF